MSQVKGQVIRQRQDSKCPWAAILSLPITEISVADNRLGISSQCYSQSEWRFQSSYISVSGSTFRRAASIRGRQ